MSEQIILRLRRADPQPAAECVVVSVESNGPLPLDLKVLGTDSETEFRATIRQKSLSSLRAGNYEGSDAEWEALIKKTLFGDVVPAKHAEAIANLECVATVSGEEEMKITWRRNTGGILQKLGSLVLKPTQDEIDLFAWSLVAADATSKARDEVADLNERSQKQKDHFATLESQLQDLLKAKKEHEQAMLNKFCQLLNSKKAKIRDQQRLLSSAVVDPQAAENLQRARGSPDVKAEKQSQGSRRGKRKAVAPQSEDSESDGFDEVQKQDVDETDERDRQRFAEEMTPEPSETDDSEDGSDLRASKGKGKPAGSRESGKVKLESQSQPAASQRETRSRAKSKEPEETKAPPPRRDLPFAKAKLGDYKGGSSQASSVVTRQQAADDTESDDEL